MTFREKNFYYKNNGLKGGRPKQDSNIQTLLPDNCLVILTPEQYDLLLDKYGSEVMQAALKILDKWLLRGGAAVKYIGKNNYGHFRSDGWVINEAKKLTGTKLY